MEKWYQALVCGKPSAKSGTLVDYLLKDARNNLSKVVPEGTRGSKRSELTYEVLESWEDQTLLKIRLLTGRHHQIRVQPVFYTHLDVYKRQTHNRSDSI